MSPEQDDLPLPPHGRAPDDGNRKPCSRCGAPTLIATLSHYGARCVQCYETWKLHPLPAIGSGAMSDTPAQREMRRELKADRPAGSLPSPPVARAGMR